MVDGSAAAASLKSQDISICENCGSEFPKRIGFTTHRGAVSQLNESESKYCSKCSIYQLDVGTCSEMIGRITRNYLASYESQNKIDNPNVTSDIISSTTEKRTRKQQRPQKLPSNDIPVFSTKKKSTCQHQIEDNGNTRKVLGPASIQKRFAQVLSMLEVRISQSRYVGPLPHESIPSLAYPMASFSQWNL